MRFGPRPAHVTMVSNRYHILGSVVKCREGDGWGAGGMARKCIKSDDNRPPRPVLGHMGIE